MKEDDILEKIRRNDEIEDMIQRAAKGAIAEFMASKEQQCRCSVDMGIHKEQHEFLGELIETMKRWNSIRWGVLQAVIIAAALGILALLGLGINHKLGG